jgi:hypothetical protein
MNHKQLVQQMTDMKAELDKYQAELTQLRSQVATYEDVEEAPAPVSTTSRRKLLRRMAIAGIGGIGALGLAASVGSTNTVLAETTSNNAIEAVGGVGGYGLRASGGLAPLFLTGFGVGSVGSPAAGAVAHQAGELYVDSAGSLYYCTSGGNPGTWRKVVGSAGAGGVSFLSTPERFIDTRTGGIIGPTPPATAGRLPANTTYTYQITGRNGQTNNSSLQVPAGATAIIISIGVITPDSGGFMYAFPAGASLPNSTVLSWPSVGNFRTGATVALSTSGQVSIRSNVATDFNLDVIGYYN